MIAARDARAGTAGRREAVQRSSKVTPQDLLTPEILAGLEGLAASMRRTLPSLRSHEQDDLVQEAIKLALERLDRFEGRSSLKTWVTSLARNKLIDLARRAAIRPLPAGEAVDDCRAREVPASTPRLRESAMDLWKWLREEGRTEVPDGAETLTLLINSGGDVDEVAYTLKKWTKLPWTPGGVRQTVRKIKRTDRGRALMATLGLPDEEEDS